MRVRVNTRERESRESGIRGESGKEGNERISCVLKGISP